jgi:hypothetical protein
VLTGSKPLEEIHSNDGFVKCPGDLDIVSDTMYNEIKERGCWVGFDPTVYGRF